MTVSALIAEDERLPRQKVRAFLAEVDWIRCVGEARNGVETVALVNQLKPDLLFLDIRMPGLDGLQVLERLTHRPTVVFTTAFDQYAVTAFEVRALDYLLKPFGQRRFRETLERVRESLVTPAEVSAVDRGLEALERDRPLRRIFVRSRGRIVPIAIEEVSRFEARDDYVAIHTGQGRFLASLRMAELERQIDPDRFVRIHRSHIVNLDAVESIVPHRSGRLLITMRDETQLFASRARSQQLRKRTV